MCVCFSVCVCVYVCVCFSVCVCVYVCVWMMMMMIDDMMKCRNAKCAVSLKYVHNNDRERQTTARLR